MNNNNQKKIKYEYNSYFFTMDPELEHLAHFAQWSEPSNTRSRKAPIQRFHFVKRSMTRKTIMNPTNQVSMQCMQGEDGKFYYIPLDSYNPEHLQIISELSPLLVNPTPAQFEPGAMYTYIVASIIRKDPGTNMDIELVPAKLYASKALNMFEFGTKHHQIFYRMANTPELDHVARTAGIPVDDLQYGLHASGEIHCITPTSLKFNFYSGTYKMQRVIPKRRAKYEMGLITRLMQTTDQAYTPEFKFTPFIVPQVLPIKHAQIDHLKSKGIPAFGFNTQAQCKSMRYSVMRHKNVEKKDMPIAEMNGIYASIVTPPPPSAGPMISLPLQAMSKAELQNLATSLKMTLPEHVLTDRDRQPLIAAISSHLKSLPPAGKGGKKRRTFTKRKSNKRH